MWQVRWIALAILFVGFSCTHSQQHVKKNIDMKITSPAFKQNEYIPKKYTCEGADVNPPLVIENIPEKAKSLVLIVDDPDAPMGTWTHWVVFNIPCQGSVVEIKENSIPGVQGWNDFEQVNYGGPCPPSGTHRYFFKMYALDTILNLKEGAKLNEVESAMKDHIIAKAELMGVYQKNKK